MDHPFKSFAHLAPAECKECGQLIAFGAEQVVTKHTGPHESEQWVFCSEDHAANFYIERLRSTGL